MVKNLVFLRRFLRGFFAPPLTLPSPLQGGRIKVSGGLPLIGRRRRALAGTAGFSLVELMVVIFLIGIMAVMIAPEMKGTLEDALLRSAARQLVSAFNIAYSRAVSFNQLHRVHLDANTREYFVDRPARQGEPDIGFVPLRNVPGCAGKIDQRITIEIRRPGEQPSIQSSEEAVRPEADTERLRNTNEGIGFYPDGTADDWEIVLRDREGFQLALRINPITARVRIIPRERK
jgi:type II secretion system protein H